MKTLTIGILAASLLFLIAGCADDDENNQPGPVMQKHLAIALRPDTLWFVFGEDATMDIAANVTNENGEPLAGQVVHLVLSDITLGFLNEGAQTVHDTTGSDGQVTAWYHAVLAGNNTLTATVDNVNQHTTLISRHPYNGTQLTLNLILNPANWVFPDMGDTALIDVRGCARDELALPVPGLNLHFTAQRGHLSADYAMTDSSGCAHVTLTGAVDDFFVDDISPETTTEVTVSIGAFSDAGLINFRRP